VSKQYVKLSHELRKDGVQILHQAARERNADIIRVFLDIVQAVRHTDRVNGLLIAQDDERQTVWHIKALRCKIQVLECLLECDNEKLTTVGK
jgi:ankyrin repeat protein